MSEASSCEMVPAVPAVPAAEDVEAGLQSSSTAGSSEQQEEPGMLSEAPGGAQEGELVDERLWGAIAALRERGVWPRRRLRGS